MLVNQLDTVSIQLVPEEVAEDTYNKMSPRYVNFYKKSNEPIFKFNHETLEIFWGLRKGSLRKFH